MTEREPGMLYDRSRVLQLLDQLYPRLVGQVDRDPDSPTFGSCDRQFWMYRLHDFDSGVIQQTALTFAALHALPDSALGGFRHLRPEHRPFWRAMAAAIARRTARLLERTGMLDEYYPGERSFPATVFGAYATLKTAHLLGLEDVLSSPGLDKAALALVTRTPSPAANQDAAAAAFLGLYGHSLGWRLQETQDAVARLVGGPRAGGVFLEYGGADLGYATVTLHFLACLRADGVYDTAPAMAGLSALLADFVTPAGALGGDFPSRSTTYFLPYGLLESARLNPAIAADFARLDLDAVFAKLDDRYLLHYCLPSLALTALSLHSSPGPQAAPTPPPSSWTHSWREEQGVLSARCGTSAVHIGVGKGAAFQVEHEGRMHIDCGYRITHDGQTYATSVIGSPSRQTVTASSTGVDLTVEAGFLRYGQLTASPLKTVILRLIRFAGPSFNAFFKRTLITKPRTLPGARMVRKIQLDFATGRLDVVDEITVPPGVPVRLAPPTSLRVVPSARFYQRGEEEAFTRATVAPPLRYSLQLTPPSGP